LLEWEERRADGTAGFGVILSTVVEEREAPSQRPTLAPGRLTSYMPRGTTCESGTPPSLPQLGRMCVSVSGVSSVLFSISWAWDSIVSCVAAEMWASWATYPSQGHERAPPYRLLACACPSVWALANFWASMVAGQNAHGARWIAMYQAAEIVATEAL